MPALGMELSELTREAEIQKEIFKLITNQYELAKIEEAKDINTIQILDKAVPPDKKSGPNRLMVVFSITTFGLLASMFYSFFSEYITGIREEESSANPPEKDKTYQDKDNLIPYRTNRGRLKNHCRDIFAGIKEKINLP